MRIYPIATTDKTPNSGLVVSLAEFKEWARIERDDEDASVTRIIKRAQRAIERMCNSRLLPTVRTALFNEFAVGETFLHGYPITAINSVRFRGEAITDPFEITPYERPACLRYASEAPGIAGWGNGALEIDYTEGYADADAVPEDLKQAVSLLAAHWYENRDLIMSSKMSASVRDELVLLVRPFLGLRLT